jgi:hypothetical protein
MDGPPRPHPLDMLRAAEVILVLRFAEPAALPRRHVNNGGGKFDAE